MLYGFHLKILAFLAIYGRFIDATPVRSDADYPILSFSPSIAEPYVEESDDEQFDRTDADHSGLISFDEFLKFDKYEVQLKQDEFDSIDTNGDGSLDRSEIEAYNAQWRQDEADLTEEIINQMIADYDEDDDSKLEEDEVIKYLRDYYMLKPKGDFGPVFDKFDKNGDNGLDANEMEYFYDNIPYDYLDYIESR